MKRSDSNFIGQAFDASVNEFREQCRLFTRRIPFLAVALCGLFAAGQASAEIKIGVVNFEKLLEEAPQTKSAMQALDNEFGPRRRELMTLADRPEGEGRQTSEGGRGDVRIRTARTPKRPCAISSRFSAQGRRIPDDASTRKNEELGKVQRYLVQEIQTYANAQGFDLVLGQGVFFAKPALDITANVLAVLTTKPANASGTSTPAPAKAPAPAKPK